MAGNKVVVEIAAKDTSATALNQVKKNLKAAEQQTKKLEDATQRLIKEVTLEGMSVGKTADEIRLMKLEQDGATASQLKAARAAIANRNAIMQTGKQSGAFNGQMRLMRGGLGQVGHQVQDVAVQLQMGQNAMLVFGQQGSQVASLFGQRGALIGAIIAVGAAFATYMMPNMKEASDAMNDLKSDSDSLIDKFDDLSDSMKEIARVKAGEKIAAQEILIAEAEIERTKAQEKLTAAQKAADLGGIVYDKTYKKLNKTIQDSNHTIELGKARIDSYRRSTDDTSDSTESLIESLEAQAFALGKTKKAVDLKKASDDGSNQADLDKINALHDQIDAFDALIEGVKAEQKELKEAAKAKKKQTADELKLEENLAAHFLKLNEAKKRSEESLKASQEQKINNYVSGLQDELAALRLSSEELVRYKANKINASAETEELIVSLQKQIDSETALKKATEESHKEELKRAEDLEKAYKKSFDMLGDGFVDAITGAKNFSDAMKDTAKQVVDSLIKMLFQKYLVDAAFGVITAGIDRGIASSQAGYGFDMSDPFSGNFAGGGYTGNGSRSGGLDGKGGFAAILHPRETVVDHHQGQSLGGDGVTINQTINVTTGVQQTVRAEIATLMPQIANAAKGAVADAKMRGGNYSKMLGA